MTIYDPRLGQPDALRLSRRRTRRSCGRGRRHRVRFGGSEIFRFRRVSQMPAASVVERTEFCTAGAGCGRKNDHTPLAVAAPWRQPPPPPSLFPPPCPSPPPPPP